MKNPIVVVSRVILDCCTQQVGSDGIRRVKTVNWSFNDKKSLLVEIETFNIMNCIGEIVAEISKQEIGYLFDADEELIWHGIINDSSECCEQMSVKLVQPYLEAINVYYKQLVDKTNAEFESSRLSDELPF